MFESKGVDVGLRLRELRRSLGLQQKDVALLSGIGGKSISSFETGARLATMKLGHLRRLLQVYGVTETEFFSDDLEAILGIDELTREPEGPFTIWRRMQELPDPVRSGLMEKFRLMVETAHDVHTVTQPLPYEAPRDDWELLNSRN